MQCVLRTAPLVVGGPGRPCARALVSPGETLPTQQWTLGARGAETAPSAGSSPSFPGRRCSLRSGMSLLAPGAPTNGAAGPPLRIPAASSAVHGRQPLTSARTCRAGRVFLLQRPHARLARAIAGRALFSLALSMDTPCSCALLLPQLLWSVLFLGTILNYTTLQQLVTVDKLTSVGDTEIPIPIKGLLPAYIVASGGTKQAVSRDKRRRKRRATPSHKRGLGTAPEAERSWKLRRWEPNPGCDLTNIVSNASMLPLHHAPPLR